MKNHKENKITFIEDGIYGNKKGLLKFFKETL